MLPNCYNKEAQSKKTHYQKPEIKRSKSHNREVSQSTSTAQAYRQIKEGTRSVSPENQLDQLQENQSAEFDANSQRQHEIKIESTSEYYHGSSSFTTANLRQQNNNYLQIVDINANQFNQHNLAIQINSNKKGASIENINQASQNKTQGNNQTKQKELFLIKGPILTQAIINNKKKLNNQQSQRQQETRQSRNRPIRDQQNKTLCLKDEKSQSSKFDITSMGLSNTNYQNQINPDFISNFDPNDPIECNQMSILAISQANQAVSHHDQSQSRTRLNGYRQSLNHSTTSKSPVNLRDQKKPQLNVGLTQSSQKMLASNGMNALSNNKAISSYSLSSKHSGYSSMTPLRDQQKALQSRLSKGLDQHKFSKRIKAISSTKDREMHKRQIKKLDFEIDDQSQRRTSTQNLAIFDRKAKPKRCWTLKQETHAEKVIEEGSDDGDNSFASDTPGHAHHRKQSDDIGIRQFSQAAHSKFEYNSSHQKQLQPEHTNIILKNVAKRDTSNERAGQTNDRSNIEAHTHLGADLQLQQNTNSNHYNANDSSVFASKNSVKFTRQPQVINESLQDENLQPYQSNPILLPQNNLAQIEQNPSQMQLDSLQIRFTYSLGDQQKNQNLNSKVLSKQNLDERMNNENGQIKLKQLDDKASLSIGTLATNQATQQLKRPTNRHSINRNHQNYKTRQVISKTTQKQNKRLNEQSTTNSQAYLNSSNLGRANLFSHLQMKQNLLNPCSTLPESLKNHIQPQSASNATNNDTLKSPIVAQTSFIQNVGAGTRNFTMYDQNQVEEQLKKRIRVSTTGSRSTSYHMTQPQPSVKYMNSRATHHKFTDVARPYMMASSYGQRKNNNQFANSIW